jgi:hypothetical protein
MAVQRLYLTNKAAGYIPPVSAGGGWDDATLTGASALGPAKAGANTSVARAETSSSGTWDVLLRRWVSDPMTTAGSLAGTVAMVFGRQESSASADFHSRVYVYVSVGDSNTVRGVIFDFVGSSEWETTGTGVSQSSSLAGIACEPGDRVVVEIGYQAQNTSITSFTGTMWYGGTGPTDLVSGSTAVTTDPAWFEADVSALFAPAEGAPEVREVLADDGDSASPPTVTTSTATAGTDLILVFEGSEFSTTDVLTEPTNGPWALVHASALPASGQPTAKVWSRTGLSGAQTITSTSPETDSLHMAVYVLAQAGGVVAASSINTDDDTTHTAPAVNAADKGLYIGFWLANGTDYTGLSSGMSQRAKLTVPSDNAMITGTKPVNAGSVSASAAFSTSTIDNVAVSVAVAPPSVTLSPTGIPSAQALGVAAVTPGPVTVAPAAVPSAEAFGVAALNLTVTAASIPSGELFGAATIVNFTVLNPAGIPSAEVFGALAVTPGQVTVAPVAVLSGLVFGAATVTGGIVEPAGIDSDEAFGVPTLTPGPVTINPVGIPSEQLIGDLTVMRIITEIARPASSALIARAQPTVVYELVCVARVPQPAGPPLLLEVDPIDWTGLSYSEELSKPPTLNAGCQVSNLTESVLQRLRNLSEQATELWLYREGRLVFAGPLLGWQVQAETLTLQALGLLAYLRLMVVAQDMLFTNKDQFTIATDLIDQWQTLEHGHFGIDITGIAPSGVTRDATYLRNELHNVGQRVEELGGRQNGFDIAVDPASRKLRLSYPLQGVDRSAGEDAIVFDERNVTSPNIICSAAPGDVASEAFGTGTGGATIYSTRPNLELRARYGRTAVTGTFDGVSRQGTLDAHVQALVDARGQALLIPGPDVRVTPDSDVSAYDVGDTVSYELHSLLGVTGAFRLRKRQVTVSRTGQEAVSVGFV